MAVTVTTFSATGAHAGARNRSSAFRMPMARAENEMAGRNGKTTRTRRVVSSTSTLPTSAMSKRASAGAAKYAPSIRTPFTTASNANSAPESRRASSRGNPL
jgi:hypothetical protein